MLSETQFPHNFISAYWNVHAFCTVTNCVHIYKITR